MGFRGPGHLCRGCKVLTPGRTVAEALWGGGAGSILASRSSVGVLLQLASAHCIHGSASGCRSSMPGCWSMPRTREPAPSSGALTYTIACTWHYLHVWATERLAGEDTRAGCSRGTTSKTGPLPASDPLSSHAVSFLECHHANLGLHFTTALSLHQTSPLRSSTLTLPSR